MGEASNNLKQRQRLNLANLQSHYHFSSLEAIKIIKQQLYLGISDALTPQGSANRAESVEGGADHYTEMCSCVQ